jgi:hypothetical protein
MPDLPNDASTSGAALIAALLADPDRLRRRFLLAQVLGPPKAKRPRRTR